MQQDRDNKRNARIACAAQEAIGALRFDAPVYITRPNLPSLETYAQHLAPAWQAQWLTNDGALHRKLEAALAARFSVPCFRLFCNGTVALLTALQALDIEDGEVITTPFTFPATVHALHWRRLRPVFGDISAHNHNLDPDAVEALITPATRAILPVHVYGFPCDVEALGRIADRHGLPIIYDAAHAFDVEYKGKSILQYGALSMLSFHATKLFTTGEGGALASGDSTFHEKLYLLKNFGIADEDTVIAPGINGKMSELHAALGLTQLETVQDEIAGRRRVAAHYSARLTRAPGLTPPTFDAPDVKSNYAYYPLRVNATAYGMDRDSLDRLLRACNIYGRRYFHPLCSTYDWCRVAPGRLPVAESAAREILCLPLYGRLPLEQASVICDAILQLGAIARETP